jgi:hypothetical protein
MLHPLAHLFIPARCILWYTPGNEKNDANRVPQLDPPVQSNHKVPAASVYTLDGEAVDVYLTNPSLAVDTPAVVLP